MAALNALDADVVGLMEIENSAAIGEHHIAVSRASSVDLYEYDAAGGVTPAASSVNVSEPLGPIVVGPGDVVYGLAPPRLVEGEACVHELVDALGLPQPLVSQHLRVLRGARLVERTRRGREMAYSLADEHVTHIVADAMTHTREHGGDR